MSKEYYTFIGGTLKQLTLVGEGKKGDLTKVSLGPFVDPDEIQKLTIQQYDCLLVEALLVNGKKVVDIIETKEILKPGPTILAKQEFYGFSIQIEVDTLNPNIYIIADTSVNVGLDVVVLYGISID